ncbi:MAG: NADH-quinone oxidoreductase subunit A [Sphingobacteriales bacterium]|jgi:NADH-quinone oxidoreductase subunit A
MAETEIFGKVLIYLLLGIAFMGGGYFVSYLIRKDAPNPEKNSPYECGEEAEGNPRVRFNVRFYVMALIFLIFDVEIVFLFPWATVFGSAAFIEQHASWGLISFIEMMVFIGVLLIGLIYAWKKGDLDWVTPSPLIPQTKSNIPQKKYNNFELNNPKRRSFNIKEISQGAVIPSISKKPIFKPRVGINKPKSE